MTTKELANAIGVLALGVFAVWGAAVWRDHAAYERVVKAEHDATFGTGEPPPKPVAPPAQPGVAVANPPAVTRRFSGTVEATDYSCYVDAICIVKVKGIDVITGMGRTTGPRLPWGSPTEVQVGEAVDVYCRELKANACTLEGDTGYYLRRKP